MLEGREAETVAFHEGLLGITRQLKPESRHDGAGAGSNRRREDPPRCRSGVRSARKAHPALIVSELRALAAAFEAAEFPVVGDEPLEGYDRMYVSDPFGIGSS